MTPAAERYRTITEFFQRIYPDTWKKQLAIHYLSRLSEREQVEVVDEVVRLNRWRKAVKGTEE